MSFVVNSQHGLHGAGPPQDNYRSNIFQLASPIIAPALSCFDLTINGPPPVFLSSVSLANLRKLYLLPFHEFVFPESDVNRKTL